MDAKTEIVDSVAATFMVNAYASHVEECEGCEYVSSHDRPGARQDWTDFAPEPTEEIRKLASDMVWQFEQANNCTVSEAWLKMLAKGSKYADIRQPQDFGFYLGSNMLGSGVGLHDIDGAHGFHVPHCEAYL